MTTSVPIIRFGGSVPGNLREWDRVLRSLNDFVKQIGGDFQISDNAQLPTNNSLVDSVRAFLPPPSPTPLATESQIDTVRAFLSRVPAAPPIETQMEAVRAFLPPFPSLPRPDDTQAILAAQVFL